MLMMMKLMTDPVFFKLSKEVKLLLRFCYNGFSVSFPLMYVLRNFKESVVVIESPFICMGILGFCMQRNNSFRLYQAGDNCLRTT